MLITLFLFSCFFYATIDNQRWPKLKLHKKTHEESYSNLVVTLSAMYRGNGVITFSIGVDDVF